MMRSPVLVALTVLILAGCHSEPVLPETSADAAPLRWLDHADVRADFAEHVERRHDTRFVSVFAFSVAGAVGLPATSEVRRLVKQYGERDIKGTTDVITSAEQQRLRHKAHEYVEQYNTFLLRYLRDHPNT